MAPKQHEIDAGTGVSLEGVGESRHRVPTRRSKKGPIWSPRRGQVDFTVPLFDRYLRQHHPL